MKVTVIGAGSTYTPELIHGFLSTAVSDTQKTPVDFPRQIALYDVNSGRLGTITEYCRMLSAAIGEPIRILAYEKLSPALEGADFVITQLRVGGNRQRTRDEKTAKKLGILAQETTGVVGLFKAYRTIPVVIDIVKEIQKTCPRAFLINFTNPSGIISSAVFRATGKKNMVGLCNVPIFVRKNLEQLIADHKPDLLKKKIQHYEKTGKNLYLVWGGLNHLSWVFDVILNGKSIMDDILEIIASEKFNPGNYYYFNREYALKTRTIPSPYLRYYTDTDEVIAEQKAKKTRGEEVIDIENRLLKIYRKQAQEAQSRTLPALPDLLSKRGGADYSRLAVKLISDVALGNASTGHILNVPDKKGFFGNPSGFIEVPVRISGKTDGQDKQVDITPVYPPRSIIHPQILELIKKVREYEEAIIKAGIKQDKTLLREAAQKNPLIPRRIESGKIIQDFIEQPQTRKTGTFW